MPNLDPDTPLHQHWFYAGETEHTADSAHPNQVLEPSTYW